MSKEIKEKIDALSLEAEKLVDPTTFVLNPKIVEISNQITALREQCQHHYVDGFCEFCYQEGENNE